MSCRYCLLTSLLAILACPQFAPAAEPAVAEKPAVADAVPVEEGVADKEAVAEKEGVAQKEAEAGKPGGDQAEPGAKQAKQEEIGSRWVRLLRDDRGNLQEMQTAVVRYAAKEGPRKGLVVDLIGAVHVGDRSYYGQLNKNFKQYDALLYELVAPEGTRVPKGRGTSNAHPVGILQNGMKSLLELEHQLERVDYTAANFVHADMSPQQFAKKMAERNESFLQMFFRLMGESIALQSKQQAQGKSSDVDFLAALLDRNRPTRLKRLMAEQFDGMESMLASFGGPDGSTIITERNKVALDVLRKQMQAAKKKIGIFYGAGHMVDMDRRLREDFKLEPQSIRWLTAWDLRLPGEGR